MSSPIDGLVWSHTLNRYIPEFPETEAPTFTVTTPRHQIEMSELPTSPRGIYKAALAAGWEVKAWLTVGDMPPTLYVSDSEEGDANQYVKGDVRFDGYKARLYAVEARVATIPLGFRAHYVGKEYADAKDNRNRTGGFDCAFLADPVGTVQCLDKQYKPIKVSRGKDQAGRIVETQASFEANQRLMQEMADRLTAENDGSFILNNRPVLTGANDLKAWLTEWASYGRLTNA